MYLEQRVEELEKENRLFRQELEELKAQNAERYVTPAQLSEIMGVHVNTIHKKIREGSIKVTRKLGDPRIPMSQFTEEETPDGVIKLITRKEVKKKLTIKEQVFGD